MAISNPKILAAVGALCFVMLLLYLNSTGPAPPADHVPNSEYVRVQAEYQRLRDDLTKLEEEKDKEISDLTAKTDRLQQQLAELQGADPEDKAPALPQARPNYTGFTNFFGQFIERPVSTGLTYVDGVPDYAAARWGYDRPDRVKVYKTEYKGELEKANICDKTISCSLEKRSYSDWKGKVPGFCEFSNLKCGQYRSFMGVVQPTGRTLSDGTKTTSGMFAASWADLMFIEFVLAQNPNMKDITEFGTASGLTSVYMGLAMKIRGGTLHTYDYKDTVCNEAKTVWLDDTMRFFQEDILTTVNEKARESLERSVQIGYFDNGNKVKEVNSYCKFLPVGSILMTHDWEVEIKLSQISDALNKAGYVSLYEDVAQMLGTHVRAWKRETEGSG